MSDGALAAAILSGVLRACSVTSTFFPGDQRGKMNADERRVDHLYARILLEAFRYSSPDERDKAKQILAAIALAKGPLRKSDLEELLSTDTRDARNIHASIESL